MVKKLSLMILLSVICMTSCSNPLDLAEVNKNENTGEIILSFYVAGHTYGAPSKNGTDEQDYMHPPFVRYLQQIAKDDEIEFGILTGDTVNVPSDVSFTNLSAALAETEKPFYIAPGNHDLSGGGIYFDKYFRERNQTFVMENNLFFILTPVDNWNIADEQLEMMKQVLSNNPNVRNIFIFTHQLIWLEKDTSINGFEEFIPNSWAYKESESNFWDEVIPLFDNFEHDIWFIAGDVGAFSGRTNPIVKHLANYHFIASGMGGYEDDNILKFSIYDNGVVKVTTIPLNSVIEKAKQKLPRAINDFDVNEQISSLKRLVKKVLIYLGIDYQSALLIIRSWLLQTEGHSLLRGCRVSLT